MAAPEGGLTIRGFRIISTRFRVPDNACGVSGMMRWMAPFHGIDVPKGV